MKIYAAIAVGVVLTGAIVIILFTVSANQARAKAALDEAVMAHQSASVQRDSQEPSRGRRQVPGSVELALEDLRREIEYLRGAVEELQADRGSRRESLNISGEGPSASNRDLAQLESTMRAEFESLRTLIGLGERHALVEAIRSDKRHVDWTAWEDVIATWKRDPEEARKMVKLLTSDELIKRFGPPTDVWANQLGLTWQYKRYHPLDTELTQEIILRLPDGFVAQLAVRELPVKEKDE